MMGRIAWGMQILCILYSATCVGGGTSMWGHDTFGGVKFAWNDPFSPHVDMPLLFCHFVVL